MDISINEMQYMFMIEQIENDNKFFEESFIKEYDLITEGTINNIKNLLNSFIKFIVNKLTDLIKFIFNIFNKIYAKYKEKKIIVIISDDENEKDSKNKIVFKDIKDMVNYIKKNANMFLFGIHWNDYDTVIKNLNTLYDASRCPSINIIRRRVELILDSYIAGSIDKFFLPKEVKDLIERISNANANDILSIIDKYALKEIKPDILDKLKNTATINKAISYIFSEYPEKKSIKIEDFMSLDFNINGFFGSGSIQDNINIKKDVEKFKKEIEDFKKKIEKLKDVGQYKMVDIKFQNAYKDFRETTKTILDLYTMKSSFLISLMGAYDRYHDLVEIELKRLVKIVYKKGNKKS